MRRFPLTIPYGWYQVGTVNELSAGEIRSVRYFGEDLILWCDESSNYHLQTAYCPHLGANISVGGEVVEDTIQCPFHAWRFRGDGAVADIPYAKQMNRHACLRTYPVQVRYGLIMAWYHPGMADPLFDLLDIPEFDNNDYVGPISRSHRVSTCLQEMAENSVDGAHFVTVHRHPGDANYEKIDFVGTSMEMRSEQVFPSSGGPVPGRLDATTNGFGWGIIRYKTLIDVCALTTNAPIDEEHSVQHFHVSYLNPDRDEKIDRIGRAFIEEVNRQFGDDVPIWENKIYVEKPLLCDGDGPIAKFRKWASQFYA